MPDSSIFPRAGSSAPTSRRRDERRSPIGAKAARASILALTLVTACLGVQAGDQAQFGQAWSRNMISAEHGLADHFDLTTGENIAWTASLGTETHSTPVVAGSRVLIGTNNGQPRDPRHLGDRGVLMCLSDRDGALLWQLAVPKRIEDQYFDWPNSGISSTATVEGNRAYLVDNRGVVLCLDLEGLANGNDGPFQNESIYFAPQPTNDLAQGAPAAFLPDGTLRPHTPEAAHAEPGPLDADILWMFDLSSGAGIWSHDAAHSSILIRGDHLYLNTGTGVDNTHRRIRRPDAPSLVVLDKRTGRYLAREMEGIAPDIFHSTWAPPSMGNVQGQDRIFFGGGNGVLYAFQPLEDSAPGAASGRSSAGSSDDQRPRRLTKAWEFRFDPTAPRGDVHRYHLNRREGPSNFYGAPVFQDGRIYLAGGGDLWWGKNAAWLKCVDASGSEPNLIWEYPLVRHTFSTAAVHDGLVYVTDCSQNLHCVEAGSGRSVWTHELQGETWASPLVADGKVFVGTRRGWFHVLAAGRTKRVLFESNLGSPISATTVAAHGRLYIATMSRLYVVEARSP